MALRTCGPLAALALDGWRLGVALSHAQRAALGFARDDGFRDVAAPASFLDAFARSAGVVRVDLADVAVPPLARAGSEARAPRSGGLGHGARVHGRAGPGPRAPPRGGRVADRGRGRWGPWRPSAPRALSFPRRRAVPLAARWGRARSTRRWPAATPTAPRRRCPPAPWENSAAAPSKASSTARCAWSNPKRRGRGWTPADREACGTRCWKASCRAWRRPGFWAGPTGTSPRPSSRLRWTTARGRSRRASAPATRASSPWPESAPGGWCAACWTPPTTALPFEGLLPVEAETSFGRANAPAGLARGAAPGRAARGE